MLRRSLITLAFGLVVTLPAWSQTAAPKPADEPYQPQVGQAGKDVIWVPTPDALVTLMLKSAKTTKDDIVYDLGAGDGKIAIAAAKEFGAQAVGIEYNPDMAKLGQRNAERAGVAGRVKIIQGDIFVEDFSKATVVTMYLLPDLNLKLRPRILAMKPGTRVVSHQFHMGEWEADETYKVEHRDAFLWIVPARVEGTWTLKETRGPVEATVTIAQQFQRIGGTATVGGKTQQILGAFVRGANVGFTFAGADGRLFSVQGVVDGDRITGDLHWLGTTSPFVAQRTKS